MSYHTFRELFKAKIISYLKIYKDITYSKAEAIWESSFVFNEQVYEIMQMIVEHDDIGILINRNPTLNYYSMLLMKVRRVKRSSSDYCLSVPLSILPGLNADFDGDILNIIAIIDPGIKYMFRKFDPIRRMIVARDTGLLNEYFSVTKSQKIDLYHFATCGAMENDIPETYPEEEFTKQPWEEEVHLKESLKLRYQMDPSEFNVVKDYNELGAILEPPKKTKK